MVSMIFQKYEGGNDLIGEVLVSRDETTSRTLRHCYRRMISHVTLMRLGDES
jgi:hypothetical protein